MIQIAGQGEEIILAAMHEFDTAQGDDKLIYAERLRAKVEAVLEMSRQPDLIDLDTLRPVLDSGYIKAGELPEEAKTRPMAPEDINNVDVVVKKKTAKKKTTEESERTKQLNQVKKMMKAGAPAGEIAKATGRNQQDVLDDMHWWEGQNNK